MGAGVVMGIYGHASVRAVEGMLRVLVAFVAVGVASGLCPLLRLAPVRQSVRLGRGHRCNIERDRWNGTTTLARSAVDAVVYGALAGDDSRVEDVVVSEVLGRLMECFIFLIDQIHI